MAYYSILPIYTPPERAAEYVELQYNGHHVLACATENGYVLERIYSTDPSDFAKADLTPGIILENNLINKIIQ